MTIKVTFPDGAVRDFPRGTTGTTVVESIGPSLAKKSVAMKWNGVVSDLSDPLNLSNRPLPLHLLDRSNPPVRDCPSDLLDPPLPPHLLDRPDRPDHLDLPARSHRCYCTMTVAPIWTRL